MPLILVPPSDLSTSASSATSTTSFDLGYLSLGSAPATVAFRIGNVGPDPVAWSLTARDLADSTVEITVSPDSGTLEPNEISDTVAVNVYLPLQAYEIPHTARLSLTDGTTVTTATITYIVVGTNAERASQYPSRSGDPTRIAGDAITRLGDTLELFVCHPVPYQPDEYGALPGWMENLVTPVCDRLSPQTGYSTTGYVIKGQFQREEPRIVTTAITSTLAPLSYSVSASLLLSGNAELPQRQWALFSRAGQEAATYKRTVYLLRRQGILYSIENIRALDMSVELSHFEADLVALHSQAQGSPDFYNPFAVTYLYQSDKPYAVFTCAYEFDVDEYGASPYLGPLPWDVPELRPVAGPMGETGATGPQGAQGPQGTTGPQGNQGTQGAQGTTGPQGYQGWQGVQGLQGLQGRQGVAGPTGSQGPQGSTGNTGTQGAQGPQGAQGVTGSQGPQGAQGPQGTTGPQGTQGAQGAVGPQGNQGWQGTQGPTGPQGAQGPQGYQGWQGLQGPQGAQGPQGNQGWQGLQGTQGAQGPQGNQGWQGPQGYQGPQGVTGSLSAAYCSVTTSATSNAATSHVLFSDDNYTSYTYTSNVTASGITYSSDTGTFTVTNAGTYYLECMCVISVSLASSTTYAILVNGVSVYSYSANSTTVPQGKPFSIVYPLAANDYVTFTTTNGNATIGIGTTANIVRIA